MQGPFEHRNQLLRLAMVRLQFQGDLRLFQGLILQLIKTAPACELDALIGVVELELRLHVEVGFIPVSTEAYRSGQHRSTLRCAPWRMHICVPTLAMSPSMTLPFLSSSTLPVVSISDGVLGKQQVAHAGQDGRDQQHSADRLHRGRRI